MFQKETLKEQMARYEFVFYAQVDSIMDSEIEGFGSTIYYYNLDSAYFTQTGYHPKLKDIEIIKGKLKEQLVDGTLVMGGNSWSMCSRTFKVGERLLIFGNRGGNERISTTICDPIWVFQSHEEYLLKKEEMQKATQRKFLGISLG
ncbi:MAG TPA: hypothetical protein VLA71_15555 [Algoriphagus sp.]|nr:hypothetical protein [Algoriphagus sp.]